MIVEKVRLTNFMNFYGVHSFEFKRGFNVVIGSGGSGKTNIARALKFAFLGQTGIKRNDLINYKHRLESLKEMDEACCKVEVMVNLEDTTYIAKSELSLTSDGTISQFTSVPSQIASLITPQNFMLIYLEPLNLDEARSTGNQRPFSERLINAMEKRLSENVKHGLKMAIIDNAFGLLPEIKAEELLNFLKEIPLDQTIFMEKRLKQSNPLRKYPEKWQINLSA